MVIPFLIHLFKSAPTTWLLGVFALATFVFFSSVSNGRAGSLPPHTVAKDSALALHRGRRVEIHVSDPNLTKDQCRALIDHYRDHGAPDGQVSVRKPSSKVGGDLMPWCVENFDGKGIFFNDYFFQ